MAQATEPQKKEEKTVKHYSLSFTLAARTGLSVRTIQRYLQNPNRPKVWHTELGEGGVERAEANLVLAKEECPAQPLRVALPFTQLKLPFD